MQSGQNSSGEVSHFSPDPEILAALGLQNETPHEVYCPFCTGRNDGRGVFLGVRFGAILYCWDSKGKFPNDPKFGERRGQRRGFWRECVGTYCDFGHHILILKDGALKCRKDSQSATVRIPPPPTPNSFAQGLKKDVVLRPDTAQPAIASSHV